jgi:hypothetical protein
MEMVNIQTKHIARIIESVIGAAMPWKFVQSFGLSRLSFVLDDNILQVQICPDRDGRRLRSLPSRVVEFENIDDEEAVEETEEMLFLEECAELLYDLGEDLEINSHQDYDVPFGFTLECNLSRPFHVSFNC